jgi:hypothetical protein
MPLGHWSGSAKVTSSVGVTAALIRQCPMSRCLQLLQFVVAIRRYCCRLLTWLCMLAALQLSPRAANPTPASLRFELIPSPQLAFNRFGAAVLGLCLL